LCDAAPRSGVFFSGGAFLAVALADVLAVGRAAVVLRMAGLPAGLAAGRGAGFFFAGTFEAAEDLLRAVAAGFFAAGLAG
jgi:hypothetical protein